MSFLLFVQPISANLTHLDLLFPLNLFYDLHCGWKKMESSQNFADIIFKDFICIFLHEKAKCDECLFLDFYHYHPLPTQRTLVKSFYWSLLFLSNSRSFGMFLHSLYLQ